jgi:hypothetical protein
VCSIAGTIDATADRAAAVVGLLNDAQAHRGPGHSVITGAGRITLGNSPAFRMPNGCRPRCVLRRPLRCASTGEDARVEEAVLNRSRVASYRMLTSRRRNERSERAGR